MRLKPTDHPIHRYPVTLLLAVAWLALSGCQHASRPLESAGVSASDAAAYRPGGDAQAIRPELPKIALDAFEASLVPGMPTDAPDMMMRSLRQQLGDEGMLPIDPSDCRFVLRGRVDSYEARYAGFPDSKDLIVAVHGELLRDRQLVAHGLVKHRLAPDGDWPRSMERLAEQLLNELMSQWLAQQTVVVPPNKTEVVYVPVYDYSDYWESGYPVSGDHGGWGGWRSRHDGGDHRGGGPQPAPKPHPVPHEISEAIPRSHRPERAETPARNDSPSSFSSSFFRSLFGSNGGSDSSSSSDSTGSRSGSVSSSGSDSSHGFSSPTPVYEPPRSHESHHERAPAPRPTPAPASALRPASGSSSSGSSGGGIGGLAPGSHNKKHERH